MIACARATSAPVLHSSSAAHDLFEQAGAHLWDASDLLPAGPSATGILKLMHHPVVRRGAFWSRLERAPLAPPCRYRPRASSRWPGGLPGRAALRFRRPRHTQHRVMKAMYVLTGLQCSVQRRAGDQCRLASYNVQLSVSHPSPWHSLWLAVATTAAYAVCTTAAGTRNPVRAPGAVQLMRRR